MTTLLRRLRFTRAGREVKMFGGLAFMLNEALATDDGLQFWVDAVLADNAETTTSG